MLQMASHNRFKQPLARDSLIIVILTLAILILSGIIGVSTVSLINSFGYEYTASSFGKFEHQLIESTRGGSGAIIMTIFYNTTVLLNSFYRNI